MKIVFFGTSPFAARVLSALVDQGVEVAAVVTRVDKPKGRRLELQPPSVKALVLERYPALSVLQPLKASSPEFIEQLKTYNADLFLVVAYGEILKSSLLALPPLGCVNIHASLLPKYRGAAPMQRALMDGVKETGITLIAMNAQMDAGDVLAIEAIPVPIDMTFGQLEVKLCDLAIALTARVLRELAEGKVHYQPQEHALATLAPKLTQEEMRINWTLPAESIHNLVRALSPLPGAWCEVAGNKRLKIKRACVDPSLHGEPGSFVKLTAQDWVVACGTGALVLQEVQLEGKRAMTTPQFLQGFRSWIEKSSRLY